MPIKSAATSTTAALTKLAAGPAKKATATSTPSQASLPTAVTTGTLVKAGCSAIVATVAVHLNAAGLYQSAFIDGSMVPPAKRRRTVKRSATRPSHTPWSKAEMEKFKLLVATEGANSKHTATPPSHLCFRGSLSDRLLVLSEWDDKAAKLGTGRTAKALHTRWMRDQGRIIDRPRMKDKQAGSTCATAAAAVAVAVTTAVPTAAAADVPTALKAEISADMVVV